MAELRPVHWVGGRLRLIDQSRLPQELVYLELSHYHEVAQAIREMKVRGAPAIGVAAAYGLALGAQEIQAKTKEEFLSQLKEVSQALASTRPTAVNLFAALSRLEAKAQGEELSQIKEALLAEAQRIEEEDVAANRALGQYGAALLEDGSTVLTHCNAGALATAGYGTALGVIRAAWEQGKKLHVFVPETRPQLQGARLTAWELKQEGIPFTLITDSMAGHFMQKGQIHCVVVGADRIAANGDTANKIGTYTLAVLAKENKIPFYVAAPLSTIDLASATGEDISIEERSPEEVTHLRGHPIAPPGVAVANPAFDVTSHRYISAIITEVGVIRAPYKERIKQVLKKEVG